MSKAVEAPKAKRREATRKDEVPRNSKGGVLVTDEELRAAFDFFDVENSGTITLANLRKRLGVFYKNMPAKEYRFLMNNKNEMTLEDLKELLVDNEVKNFDPVVEAFKVYDPEGTGYVDRNVLRSIFENLGFGEVTDDDVAILTETGDVDGDGRISLQDFRKMLAFNNKPDAEPETST
ncbi:hypothetical protein M885DRAFT_512673 [Pelagophyceae sp. CCMP2097]|nr:hypothetical protein M885DRAFT_512673 [Pelagophyceae sp. CCMP2097]|mmetsp:Transcript_3597/g.10913  ORF Transcript_3597/g.10913 Transcript_3597/m.10913 type:complete len:178 (-) Transcript_3597:36-569(-)